MAMCPIHVQFITEGVISCITWQMNLRTPQGYAETISANVLTSRELNIETQASWKCRTIPLREQRNVQLIRVMDMGLEIYNFYVRFSKSCTETSRLFDRGLRIELFFEVL